MNAPTGGVAEFIRSPFGGGWIIPLSDEAAEICRDIFREDEAPLASIGGTSGWIVEPQDLADTVESLRNANCEVML